MQRSCQLPNPLAPIVILNITVSNGRIHNKKPKFQCQDCKRQFVENPTNKVICQEIKELIDRLLLEKIPLTGIARAAQVSSTWLQEYVNNKYAYVPQQRSPSTRKAFTEKLSEVFDAIAEHLPETTYSQKRAKVSFMFAAMAGAVSLARAAADPSLSKAILESTREYLLNLVKEELR